MSINHQQQYYYYPSPDQAHNTWWPSQHNNNMPPPKIPNFWSNNNQNDTTSTILNLNNNMYVAAEEEANQVADELENNNTTIQSKEDEIPKMPLFEKPLTPSDVGKLNRLVIPKQHAEKYFPLNNNATNESGTVEKGLLLSFEDETGKSWRFRYSYWNSSQSYVLTKGWSRFVKEKKLDAGDIVLFLRHGSDAGRLFIGWRRRNVQPESGGGGGGGGGGSGGGWNRMFSYSSNSYGTNYGHGSTGTGGVGSASLTQAYRVNCTNAGSVVAAGQNTTSGSAGSGATGNPKRLRLFGVNMECHTDDSSEPSTSDGSPMSSQAQAYHHHPYHHQYNNNYNNHNMDISFSGGGDDVYQYRQG